MLSMPSRGPAILEYMTNDRPQADRILVAQLTGESRHRARWRELTEDEEAGALAELQALAGGRADLLAEVAGIQLSPRESFPARQACPRMRRHTFRLQN